MQKIIAFTVAVALAASAQTIETEKSDRHKVIRVKTAHRYSEFLSASPDG